MNAVEKEDVRAVYEKFGNVTDVWIAHNPPGFAFVEFDTEEAANKAVEETNGTELFGGNVRVQITKGRREGRRNRGLLRTVSFISLVSHSTDVSSD